MQKQFKCQLCSSSSFEIIQKTIRNAHFGNYIDFDVNICKVCNLIQLNDFMSEGKTRNYYKFKYLEDTYKYQVRPDYFVQDQKLRGKNVFNFLKKNKNIFKKEIKDLDVIDIGCDTGGTLDYFVEKTKSIVGVDPIVKSVKLAKKLGYKVKQGFIEDLNITDNSKDLIILLGTIEHAYDLNKAMNECVRILKSNGLIFIRWRSDKLWGSPIEYFNSNHYRYFNYDAFKFLANKFKLKIVLKTVEEIENKPGAEYIILMKTENNSKPYTIKNNAYKKTIRYFENYNKKYLKNSISYLTHLRDNSFNVNKAKKFIVHNKSFRSLSKRNPDIKRTIIEAKEFINYYFKLNSS